MFLIRNKNHSTFPCWWVVPTCTVGKGEREREREREQRQRERAKTARQQHRDGRREGGPALVNAHAVTKIGESAPPVPPSPPLPHSQAHTQIADPPYTHAPTRNYKCALCFFSFGVCLFLVLKCTRHAHAHSTNTHTLLRLFFPTLSKIVGLTSALIDYHHLNPNPFFLGLSSPSAHT